MAKKILDRRINQLTKKIRFFSSYEFPSEEKKEEEKIRIIIEFDEIQYFPSSEISLTVLCKLYDAAKQANVISNGGYNL